MTPEEQAHLATQTRLIEIAREITAMDLATFVSRASRTETLAPMLGPTPQRNGGATLSSILALGEAAAEFKRCLRSRGILAQLAIEAYAQRPQRARP